MRPQLVACLLGGILASGTGAEAASILFAATAAGGPGVLYTLDQTDGSLLSTIGSTNDVAGTNYPITGLAFHPVSGVLYGSTAGNPTSTAARLVTIDPTTALVTVIGPYNAGPTNSAGREATMADLAFDAAGNLYGIGSIGGPQLYSIDITTGQATVIGHSGLTATSGGGLAIGPTGVFFGTPTSSRFGTYDTTLLPPLDNYIDIGNPPRPLGGAYNSLAFDGSVLFGINGASLSTALVTFNLATGDTTLIGTSLSSIDAIAFQTTAVPVPEPATFGLVAGSLAVLALIRRRRKSSSI